MAMREGYGRNSSGESIADDPEVEALLASAEILARILDTAIRIPGTRVYIGLDPLIGLIRGSAMRWPA